MLRTSSIWLIILMGIFGGIGISHFSTNWMAAFFGLALSGLSFFIGVVMGILFEREQGKREGESTGGLTPLEEQQKMLIASLLSQKKIMAEASELIAKGVGSSVAVKMVDEMFKNKENLEHLDSILTRAEEIVDTEVKEVYRKMKDER